MTFGRSLMQRACRTASGAKGLTLLVQNPLFSAEFMQMASSGSDVSACMETSVGVSRHASGRCTTRAHDLCNVAQRDHPCCAISKRYPCSRATIRSSLAKPPAPRFREHLGISASEAQWRSVVVWRGVDHNLLMHTPSHRKSPGCLNADLSLSSLARRLREIFK